MSDPKQETLYQKVLKEQPPLAAGTWIIYPCTTSYLKQEPGFIVGPAVPVWENNVAVGWRYMVLPTFVYDRYVQYGHMISSLEIDVPFAT